MTVLHINENEFQQEVLEAKEPVLVDFYATWCGPCKMQAKVLDDMAKTEKPYKIVKVDVDTNPNLARDWNAHTIPSLFIVKDGKIMDSMVGFQPQPVLEGKLNKLV